jgi:hypothetical protein
MFLLKFILLDAFMATKVKSFLGNLDNYQVLHKHYLFLFSYIRKNSFSIGFYEVSQDNISGVIG